MSSASRVQRFLEEVGAKRPAPPAAQAAGETLLLPITLQMDHNPKGDAPREVRGAYEERCAAKLRCLCRF